MEVRGKGDGKEMLSGKSQGDSEAVMAREAERGGVRLDEGGKRSGRPGMTSNLIPESGAVEAESGAVEAESESGTVPHAWSVPDGGWGWVVVLSAMVISLIVDGLSYTFGLFLGEFERAFKEPKSTVSLASSLQVGIYLFIGPIVSALTNRFGCRPIIVLGSCLSCLSFVASSQSEGVTSMILTYGMLAGIGFGLMYLPSIVAVSIYFEKKRAVATGIAVCGTGVGTFLLAPLTDYLLQEYNWRGTLLILSGLVLNGAVFGALVRPLKLRRGEPSIASTGHDNAGVNGPSQIGEKAGVTKRTSNGKLEKEQIPLISLTDAENQVTVSIDVGDTNPRKPRGLFFSSTPAMAMSQGAKAEFGKDGTHLSPLQPASKVPGAAPRRRAQSTSDHTITASPVRVRSHAPIGLALISLSDVNLDQIRADVKLPLSRKDVHLSGPLPFPESDARTGKVDRNLGLYIQSVQSIASLSAATGVGVDVDVDGGKTRGFWSCLPRSVRETMEEMFDLSILKEKCLWCVLLGNFFCMLGIYVPFVYVPERALLLGIPEDQTAFLISIIGITNTVGRVMTGVLINFLNLDCAAVTSVALFIAGITAAMCPFCQTYSTLAAASAVYGICVAAYISLCSVLICELLGVENLTNAFGFVILFRGIACMVGPPMAGAIIDETGVFEPSFYLAGGVIALGGLSHAALFIPCIRRRRRV